MTATADAQADSRNIENIGRCVACGSTAGGVWGCCIVCGCPTPEHQLRLLRGLAFAVKHKTKTKEKAMAYVS